MMPEKKQSKLIFLSFLCLFVYEFAYILHDAELDINSDNYFILLYVTIGCLIALMAKTDWKADIPRPALTIYYLMLAWNFVAIVHGMITANGYQDYKNTLIHTGGGLSLIIPLAMMAGMGFQWSGRMLKLCLLIFLLSFFAIPIAIKYFNEIYPRIVTPVAFFILLIPFLKAKDRLVVLAVAVVAVGIGLTWRANVLRIGMSVGFLMLYYFRSLIGSALLTIAQVAIFVVPLYFLYEGINGKSIFANDDDKEYNVVTNGEESNLAADTRTILYEEVFKDLVTTESLWLGKGSNGKYKTELDFELLAELGDERPSVEVGFLKILIHTGILGMLIYTVLLGMAIFYGTWRSANFLSKMIAMFLAAHWLMLFIENSIDFSMYFYFSWFAVGLCFSEKFRAMSNDDIRNWVRGVPVETEEES